MHLFSLVLPVLYLGVALGSLCENGLVGWSDGDACCADECGECGGPGCSTRVEGFGGDECCTANIVASGILCADSGAAPCLGPVATVTPEPTPEETPETPEETPEIPEETPEIPEETPEEPETPTTGFSCSGDAGILDGDICCEASCETCGGPGCSSRGNGAGSCCTSEIAASGEVCSVTGAAPCIVDGDVIVTPPEPVVEPTPEATPEPETPTTGFSCSGDAGILDGDICCEASCETCGGPGCSSRGNGAGSCCTSEIAASGEVCSVTGAAPCIVDGDVIVTPPEPVVEPTPEATPEPETPTTGFSCTGDAGISEADVCCEASCGTCGGSGCSGRGNGQFSCCTLQIRQVDAACSETGAAPCIIDGDEPVDPTPEPETPTTSFSCTGDAGIPSSDVCCEASCGTCGGSGCSSRGNGEDSCCTSQIAANGELCSVTEAAPCIIDGIPEGPPEPIPEYQEVGCFVDMEADRIMVNAYASRSSMTIEFCQAHCTGSAYFGVQYAEECWCSGTDATDYPYDVHGESTGCDAPCAGNSGQICGGNYAVNVYQNVYETR